MKLKSIINLHRRIKLKKSNFDTENNKDFIINLHGRMKLKSMKTLIPKILRIPAQSTKLKDWGPN